MEKKNLSRIGFALAVTCVLFDLVGFILGFTLSGFIDRGIITAETANIVSIVISPFITLLCLFVFSLITRNIKSIKVTKSKITVSKLIPLIFCGLGLIYIGNLLTRLVMWAVDFIINGKMDIGNQMSETMQDLPIPVIFLFVAVAAPIFEELFFRKVLLDKLRPYGYKTAVALSALSFGLFHRNFEQAFYAFCVGIILGAIAYKTGDIRYTIIIHMIVNIMGSVVPLIVMEGSTIAVGIYGLFAIVLMISTIIVFIVAGRKYLKIKPWEEVHNVSTKTAFANPGFIVLYVLVLAMCIYALYK
ncbi:MAG: CPBP family intramembrane metalloprotease [Lachnospiraceae bacterium]|nr:CPBP family intramembrane metalloprotease [Lachnospiraceae bacterium]